MGKKFWATAELVGSCRTGMRGCEKTQKKKEEKEKRRLMAQTVGFEAETLKLSNEMNEFDILTYNESILVVLTVGPPAI